jgi:tetratricopeptide (TPR) repeat protein
MTSPSLQPVPQPLKIFLSYSHEEDEALKNELIVHLTTLKRQGKILTWQDREIEAGAEWDTQIKQQLEAAEIILLLISAQFIASDYCYDLEMQRAVERHDGGTARVIPIILRACDWQHTPFAKLQALPQDGKPITKWDDRDEAFLNVVQGIRLAVESLQATKQTRMVAPDSKIAVSSRSIPRFSAYNPQTFTGRDTESAQFTALLSGSCRVFAIVGMTGIGKTALAERVVANLMESAKSVNLPYIRFSLDDRNLSPDFSVSGAALLRTLGEEPTLADQQDAVNLLTHILDLLGSIPCRLQIDSLERLLKGNEREGWSEFCDSLWLDLLHQFVASNNCSSQLLLTSQDIPSDLDTVASRYPQFWQCQTLQGLKPDEQRDLFQKLGLPANPEPKNTELEALNRIGAFYDGHPLVLQVIADEMLKPPFQSNIARYWHHYEAEFSDTADITKNKLAQSHLFRRRVRERVEQSLQRLPSHARQMLCASAVFHRSVPIGFWLAMLTDEDAQAAFDMLQELQLVEFVAASDETLLVRQHNLIRSVAYDLLKADTSTWQQAERKAAELWLTDYKPEVDAPNLETIRGYLEAFEHYCQVGDWNAAKAILLDQGIGSKLQTWGNYQEMLICCRRLLGHLPNSDEVACQRGLGNAYYLLSNYPQAILYYQQSLDLAKEIDDKQGQCKALNNLGNVSEQLGQYAESIKYLQQTLALAHEIGDRRGEGNAQCGLGNACNSLGQYERAIDFYQQHLTIAREIGDRQGEGNALSGLGNAYNSLGQYERAIDFYQQHLTIAREIGDRQGEGNALGNLGFAYNSLGQYERAIDFYQQHLTIAREIGDRQGEGIALGNLGYTHHGVGQYEQAMNFHQKYLTIAREICNRQCEGIALSNLGGTELKLGQYSESEMHNQLALEIFQEIGDKANESEALKNLAELHQALDKVEVARQYCQQALELATELCIPIAAECQALMESLVQETQEAKVVQEEIS